MIRLLQGDCREVLGTLPEQSVQCCVTSPPYWGLRDYGVEGQIGLERTPEEYVAKMVGVFSRVRRVLRQDGTLWLNLGDSYARAGGDGACGPNASVGNTKSLEQRRCLVPPPGLKPKDLVGIPWRVALALQQDGWWLRSDIIWHKPNPMPESVTDRPTKAHEYVFLLSKSARYRYNTEAIKEPAQDWGLRDRTGGSRTALDVDYMPAGDSRHRGLTNAKQRGNGPQRSFRLDHRDPAVFRGPLRHVPRGVGGTLPQGGHEGGGHGAGPVWR